MCSAFPIAAFPVPWLISLAEMGQKGESFVNGGRLGAQGIVGGELSGACFKAR
jgi:hypothetical protein